MIIGIIGVGYVGTALKEGFKDYYQIKTYDLDSSLSSCKTMGELIFESKLIFLCLPTPMNKNGSCDLSIVENIIDEISSLIKDNSNKIIIIKSTVPPGTTENLNNKYQNFNIIFNPEFLTEANFIEDFKNQNRIILGGLKSATSQIYEFYTKIFPKAKIIETDSTYAEMVKYFSNTFLATKVSFANEMKIICDKLDIDYSKVVEYATYDNRLGNSHWSVPGPDGNLGFGGSCFPKDINALISIASKLGVDPILLKSVWKTNLKVRPKKDWENLKGRAVTNNKD
ncbi:nucleotide sugar dehydrogenase [bacterium]|nr:nucleotide sugar dehydrogenase [bacterium]